MHIPGLEWREIFPCQVLDIIEAEVYEAESAYSVVELPLCPQPLNSACLCCRLNALDLPNSANLAVYLSNLCGLPVGRTLGWQQLPASSRLMPGFLDERTTFKVAFHQCQVGKGRGGT